MWRGSSTGVGTSQDWRHRDPSWDPTFPGQRASLIARLEGWADSAVLDVGVTRYVQMEKDTTTKFVLRKELTMSSSACSRAPRCSSRGGAKYHL